MMTFSIKASFLIYPPSLARRAAALEIVARDAAVHDHHRAVRPVGLVGGEVKGAVDDLLRLAEAAGRLAIEAHLLRRLVLQEPFGHQRRLDRAGADGVRADAARPELAGGGLGHGKER